MTKQKKSVIITLVNEKQQFQQSQKGEKIMANKTTKLDNMVAVKAFLVENNADQSLIEAIKNEIDLLEKKKANRKPSKTQEANVLFKEQILIALKEGRMRASEVGQAIDITPNKASALLRQLVQSGEVERIEEKRVAYFQLATE